ncbi:MAG: hypothetical protein ABI968_15660, partial [Acidobacteriota bacterium]
MAEDFDRREASERPGREKTKPAGPQRDGRACRGQGEEEQPSRSERVAVASGKYEIREDPSGAG